MELNEMMEYVHQVNVEHGWFDTDRPFSADIALLHSEVSEAYEAYRKGELSTTRAQGFDVRYNPSSLSAELADILIRLLDTCKRYNIDIEEEFLKKMKYNENRDYRHGGKVE